ncbi:unnamed protein product, partial [Menidia menidia]
MKFITGGSIASILHSSLPHLGLAHCLSEPWLYTHQILEGVTYLHLNRVQKSDIVSVGCKIFEMATEKPLPGNMDKMALVLRWSSKRVDDIKNYFPKV